MDQQKQLIMSVGQTLKCTSCQQYLSVAPIYINSDGYWCGRCELALFTKLDASKQTYHLAAYEALANTLQFSCQYDVLGCEKKLNFKDVQAHEIFCKFKIEKCPVVDCQIKINAGQLLGHYQEYHKQLIIEAREFSLALGEDLSQNYVTVLNSKPYILSVLTSIEQEKIYIGVYNFSSNDVSTKDNYLLAVKTKNTNSLIVNEERIQKYNPEDGNSQAQMLHFDYKHLRTLLRGDDLIFSIKLPEVVVKNKLGGEVLEELECIVCQDYMEAPIYICATGHSICSKCRKRVAQCPLCEAVFAGARNFALEKLCEKAEVACKIKKGNFLTKIKELTLNCPLKTSHKCQWAGLAKDIFAHSNENHSQFTFPKIRTMKRNLEVTLAENFLMCYGNNTFKVFVKNHGRGPFRCTILHNELPISSKPQYRFVINFNDHYQCQTLSIGNLCYSAQKCAQKQQDAMSYIAVEMPHSYLVSFGSKENFLSFTIEIKQIEAA